jgi:hypothetical protein
MLWGSSLRHRRLEDNTARSQLQSAQGVATPIARVMVAAASAVALSAEEGVAHEMGMRGTEERGRQKGVGSLASTHALK